MLYKLIEKHNANTTICIYWSVYILLLVLIFYCFLLILSIFVFKTTRQKRDKQVSSIASSQEKCNKKLYIRRDAKYHRLPDRILKCPFFNLQISRSKHSIRAADRSKRVSAADFPSQWYFGRSRSEAQRRRRDFHSLDNKFRFLFSFRYYYWRPFIASLLRRKSPRHIFHRSSMKYHDCVLRNPDQISRRYSRRTMPVAGHSRGIRIKSRLQCAFAVCVCMLRSARAYLLDIVRRACAIGISMSQCPVCPRRITRI